MATAVPILPERQVRALEAAYHAARAWKRRQLLGGAVILALCVAAAAWAGEVNLATFWANLGRFTSYLGRLLLLESGQPVWTDIAEWYWGIGRWTRLLVETLLIAYIGTTLGGLAAFVLCFLAAANLLARRWVRFLTRRLLEFSRTVPEIVFALIFVVAFGLGPLPGVLAIAIHTTGALGKLFAEAVENIDMSPVDGVTASGATWWQAVRFAVLPQVLSTFASYGLLRFEINVRGAAVMGFVGAGGIGQDLLESVRKFYYADVSAILLMVILTVIVIDLATERLRHYLIGMEKPR
jgi:phosphonate transport system permease protein